MAEVFNPLSEYRIKLGRSFNYSHMDQVNKSLISFPFNDMGNVCPRNAYFELSGLFGTIIRSGDAICMFRPVPHYLCDGKDGHLVVFFDCDHDIGCEVRRAEHVLVKGFGEPIIGHHLCTMSYFLD